MRSNRCSTEVINTTCESADHKAQISLVGRAPTVALLIVCFAMCKVSQVVLTSKNLVHNLFFSFQQFWKKHEERTKELRYKFHDFNLLSIRQKLICLMIDSKVMKLQETKLFDLLLVFVTALPSVFAA